MSTTQPISSKEKEEPIKLYENKIFAVFFNGYYHYVEYTRCPVGAVVIPRFPNGDFLLVELRRAPAFGFSLEFPRGGVDRGETPEDGALRELKEETGFAADPTSVTYLGALGADTATINGRGHVFLIDLATDEPATAFDSVEIARVVRLSPSELRQRIRDNRIFDGQTLAAYGMMQARL